MKLKKITTISALTLCTTCASSQAALSTIEISYDLTHGGTGNGSINTTAVITDPDAVGGISSTLTIGSGFGDLTDNSAGTGAIRVAGDDNAPSGTGSSITADTMFTITVTLPSLATIQAAVPGATGANYESLELTWESTNTFQYSNARVYSDIAGNDDVTGDTIGRVGDFNGGSNPLTTSFVSLSDPESNTNNGANVSNGDFDSLEGQTLTFFIPWVDASSSATRYNDLSNITITVEAVPEPSTALLSGITLLGLLRRRR